MADLFADEMPDAPSAAVAPDAPLADRLRPHSLADVVGQLRGDAGRKADGRCGQHRHWMSVAWEGIKNFQKVFIDG